MIEVIVFIRGFAAEIQNSIVVVILINIAYMYFINQYERPGYKIEE